DGAGLEVAGRADFGLVPHIDPARVENTPQLEPQDFRIDHGCAVDREARGLRIVQHQGAVVHGVSAPAGRRIETACAACAILALARAPDALKAAPSRRQESLQARTSPRQNGLTL